MDNALIAAITAAAAAMGTVVGSVITGRRNALATERTAEATERVGLVTAGSGHQAATEKLLFDQLQFIQNRSDKIESEMRKELKELQDRLASTNERVFALERERENLLTDHARKEREWDLTRAAMEDIETSLRQQLTVATDTIALKEKRITQMLDTQTKLADYIRQHDATWKPDEDIIVIGDVEIQRNAANAHDAAERFSARFEAKATKGEDGN